MGIFHEEKGLPFIITLPIFNSSYLRYQIMKKLILNAISENGSSDLPLQIEEYDSIQCVEGKHGQYMTQITLLPLRKLILVYQLVSSKPSQNQFNIGSKLVQTVLL